MGYVVSFLGWFGGAFTWLIKEFIPTLAKKLGLGAITGVIQKGVSIAVIALVVSFFGFVIYFITTMYTAFRDFLSYLTNLPGGGEWGSCFLNMLNASGVASGVNMAMPFLMSVLVFYFGYATYKVVIMVSKMISDETSKTIESFK